MTSARVLAGAGFADVDTQVHLIRTVTDRVSGLFLNARTDTHFRRSGSCPGSP